jgi:hypothetical protein
MVDLTPFYEGFQEIPKNIDIALQTTAFNNILYTLGLLAFATVLIVGICAGVTFGWLMIAFVLDAITESDN